PPYCSGPLKRFCELLYWNELEWRIENSRQVWSANLFKSPYVVRFAKPNLQRLIAYLFEGILVSLIVQIWMLPLVVFYFHRVSVASVLLNLWVGFFLALESFAALAAVFVNTFSTWLATPLITAAEFSNSAMLVLPSWFSAHDLAGFRLPVYSGVASGIYFVYGAFVAISAAALFGWEPFSLIAQSLRSRIVMIASSVM